MKLNLIGLTMAAAAALFQFAPSTASAGSLDNAALGCFVDTFAWDELTNDYCGAAWTPSTANTPSVAHFEVTGIGAGNFSYSWSNSACGNVPYCQRPIRARPEQIIDMSVTVTDYSTGASRTLYAQAEYINGYN